VGVGRLEDVWPHGLRFGHGRPVIWEHDLTVIVLDRGIPVGSSVGEVARGSRERPGQDLPQLVTILVGQPSEQLEALRGRRLTGELDVLLRLAPPSIREPFDGGLPLIQRRALAPRTTRDWNLLAPRDRELQVDQLAPPTRRATHFEGQIDEREASTARISGLPRAPGAQVRKIPSVFVTDFWRAHAGDSATAAGVMASGAVEAGLPAGGSWSAAPP
jgi:hypothetical protein